MTTPHTEHRQGCDALGGYGHGVGPCTCGAATSNTELAAQLLAAANYIDALGGDSRGYRQALADALESKAEPVRRQHRKPLCDATGNVTHFSDWRDGGGLAWWPHRTLYAAPVQPEKDERKPLSDAQLGACIRRAGFKTWDSRMWALKREIEAAHGIGSSTKGGA